MSQRRYDPSEIHRNFVYANLIASTPLKTLEISWRGPDSRNTVNSGSMQEKGKITSASCGYQDDLVEIASTFQPFQDVDDDEHVGRATAPLDSQGAFPVLTTLIRPASNTSLCMRFI